MHSHWKQR